MIGMDDQKDHDIYSSLYAEGMPMILQMTQQTATIPFLTLLFAQRCRSVALWTSLCRRPLKNMEARLRLQAKTTVSFTRA